MTGIGRKCKGAVALCCAVGVMAGLATAALAQSRVTEERPRLSVFVRGVGGVKSEPPGLDCGTRCRAHFPAASTVMLQARPADGQRFLGWSGPCAGRAACSITLERSTEVGAQFAPEPEGRFRRRPHLFAADELRLRAAVGAGDPEATGFAESAPGRSMGFLSLARQADADRQRLRDIPTWQIAFAGWLLNDEAMLRRARDEALALIAPVPAGDSGRGEHFQHIEDRMLNVAAVADLAPAQFNEAQLVQVARWVNGTLANWRTQNMRFWPVDEPLNNYWQNGFLAHVVAGLATEGFNPQALHWRAEAQAMAAKFVQRTTVGWSGPVQSEGHYYSGYVHHAFWALELLDAALGTDWLQRSRFSVAEHLNLLMYQTRPHLTEFFEVGSEASAANAPHTHLSLAYWHHLISSGRYTPQAAQARAILEHVLPRTQWPRWSKGFVNFYWSIYDIERLPLSAKPDRMYAAPTPGAGLIGVRSSAGFEPTARAALMFANHFGGGAAYSHSNPDAPGFQWADAADWLVTDPEYFNSSGIIAEAGPTALSDVSNIVTLAGHRSNPSGAPPRLVRAEDKRGAPVPHVHVQIDSQPYWNMTSTYRRDYVWLDDLRALVIWDRIVGRAAKTWRLHAPAAISIDGPVAAYTVNGKTVRVRNLLPAGGLGWRAEPAFNVWRLSQDDPGSDYRSLKVLDVGARVEAAVLGAGSGWHEARITIDGVTRSVRFHDDGGPAVLH